MYGVSLRWNVFRVLRQGYSVGEVGTRGCPLTQSQSPAKIGEILKQYTLRCKILGIDLPEMLVINNCCQVRKSVTGAVPEIKVALDVYHFLN